MTPWNVLKPSTGRFDRWAGVFTLPDPENAPVNLLTTFLFAALQEPAEIKPLHPLITTTIFLVFFGVLVLIARNEIFKTDKPAKPSEQETSIEVAAGCFGALFMFFFWIGLALGVIALVFFGLIKAVKYVWFF